MIDCNHSSQACGSFYSNHSALISGNTHRSLTNVIHYLGILTDYSLPRNSDKDYSLPREFWQKYSIHREVLTKV